MEFKQIDGAWIGFRDSFESVLLGEFVEAQEGNDDAAYFYFRPAPDQILSCRDCRKAAEKLSELNGRLAHNTLPDNDGDSASGDRDG